MKGKNLNSGIRGGIWEKKHYDAMGAALWLFGWCVHRQTKQKNGEGLVLGGKAMTYEMISEDTGFEVWQLRRWMLVLKETGYVRVAHSTYKRMVIYVLNAKKFSQKQLDLPGFQNVQNPRNIKRADSAQTRSSKRTHSAQINHRTELSTEQIKTEEEAAPAFVGHIFTITAKAEARLAEWFPNLARNCEYVTADLWCEGKGRNPKNPLLFMRKWLLKTEQQQMTQSPTVLVPSEAYRPSPSAQGGFSPKALARIRQRELNERNLAL